MIENTLKNSVKMKIDKDTFFYSRSFGFRIIFAERPLMSVSVRIISVRCPRSPFGSRRICIISAGPQITYKDVRWSGTSTLNTDMSKETEGRSNSSSLTNQDLQVRNRSTDQYKASIFLYVFNLYHDKKMCIFEDTYEWIIWWEFVFLIIVLRTSYPKWSEIMNFDTMSRYRFVLSWYCHRYLWIYRNHRCCHLL